MAKKTDEYKKDIERALRSVGTYSKSLDIQIISLAGAMRTLALANEEIDALDKTTYLTKNRYGQDAWAPHPVFKIQREAQESVTRQMKALGLTAEQLAGNDENDPLVDLSKRVRESAKRRPMIVKPDSE